MKTTEDNLRRAAYRRGKRLIKFRKTCRWYAKYGPFAIVDAMTNAYEASGITKERAAEYIEKLPTESGTLT